MVKALKKFNSWELIGDKRVSVLGGAEPRPKKLTATRLGAVLGYNQWKTPFQAWCEICRVAELPFTANKFTVFGNVVEEKMNEFSKEFISPNLKRPVDIFGSQVERMYDYYKDDSVFGGMWDALVHNRNGECIGVVEYKSSSRPQDWMSGAPLFYRAQALLYAWKEGVEDYWVVCTFPEQSDYPEECNDNGEITFKWEKEYEVTTDNTRIFHYKVSDGLDSRNVQEIFNTARAWYEDTVLGNLSPVFDKKKDKEYLEIMRTSRVEIPTDLEHLSKQVADLDDRISDIRTRHGIADLEAELKELKDKVLKKALKEACEEGRTKIETNEWCYSKSKDTKKVNEKLLKDDGLFEKYQEIEPGGWRLTRNKKEG